MHALRLPNWLSGKESRRCGFSLWVRKIPWRRKWQPTPIFLLQKIPWTEEPGGLQSIGCHRVRHDWGHMHAHPSLYIISAAAKSLQSCPTLCDPIDSRPTRLPRPWDSPEKNTGVGCHFLLQRMKVKSKSEVAQLCPTLSDPMDCSQPGSAVHGIFQARVLEWGAIAFSHNIHRDTQKTTSHSGSFIRSIFTCRKCVWSMKSGWTLLGFPRPYS